MTLTFRQPVKQDGKKLYQLVRSLPALDVNSEYAYCLLATHFAHSSVVATVDDSLVGMLVGYRLQDSIESLANVEARRVLFVWQVGVLSRAQNQGVAYKMLCHLLKRPCLNDIQYIHATATDDNMASIGLFKKIARYLNADFSIAPWLLDSDFSESHQGENLIQIGPFKTQE